MTPTLATRVPPPIRVAFVTIRAELRHITRYTFDEPVKELVFTVGQVLVDDALMDRLRHGAGTGTVHQVTTDLRRFTPGRPSGATDEEDEQKVAE